MKSLPKYVQTPLMARFPCAFMRANEADQLATATNYIFLLRPYSCHRLVLRAFASFHSKEGTGCFHSSHNHVANPNDTPGPWQQVFHSNPVARGVQTNNELPNAFNSPFSATIYQGETHPNEENHPHPHL